MPPLPRESGSDGYRLFIAFLAGFVIGSAFMASPAVGLALALLSGLILLLSFLRRRDAR